MTNLEFVRLSKKIDDNALKDSDVAGLELNAENGDIEAAYLLGLFYTEAKDYAAALKCFTVRNPMQQPRLALGLGQMYQQQGDTRNSIKYFEAAIQTGNAEAKYLLGKNVLLGLNHEVQPRKALRLIEEAANQGNARAQLEIGMAYFKGLPRIALARDQSKAKRVFLSVLDNPESNVLDKTTTQYLLGLVYSDFHWYYHDVSQAIEYFRLALNTAVPDTNDRDSVFFTLSAADIRQLKNAVILCCQNLHDIYSMAQTVDRQLLGNLEALPPSLERHWLYHPFYIKWEG